jgi:hypothetical protein
MNSRLLAAGALVFILAVAGCAPAQTGGSPAAEASAGDDAGTDEQSQKAVPDVDAGGDDGNSAPDDYDY